MNNLKNEIKNDLENKMNVDLTFDTSSLKPNKKNNKGFVIGISLFILVPLVICSIPFLSMMNFSSNESITRKKFTVNEKQVMENSSFKKLNEIVYPSLENKNILVSDDFKTAINDFSNEIFQKTYKEENYSFSPISLYYLLNNISLATNKEEVNSEFDNILRLDRNNRKENLIRTYKNNYFCNEYGTIQMYNSVFLSNSYQYNEEYVKSLKDYYIEAYQLSFKNDQDKILEWIDDKLNENNFMSKRELNINDDTIVYFLNTLFFNNRWYHTFNDENNYQDVFNTLNGTENVTYMTHSYYGEVNEHDKYIDFTDYYQNGIKIKYLISKNNDNIFDLVKNINIFEKKLEVQEACINLSLPKFSNSYFLDFTSLLKDIMPKTFSENSLNNVFNDTSAALQFVKQKNEITFSEDGTTIKSVSFGAGSKATAPIEGYDIKLNKPFIYIIYDINDIPLFIGNMINPNK